MHVLTLDLDEAGPERPRSGAFASARALALFVENPSSNEAYAPGNEHAVVLALTDDELADGVPEVEGWADWEESSDVEPDDKGRTLEVVPIQVPIGGGDRIPEATRTELARLAANLPGRVGGHPLWIQSEERGAGEFVLQCDERLASINLGDMGRLYVFTDTAFWQCY